jgi:hypothetical protein
MLGKTLGYLLKHPFRAAVAVTTDPAEAWTRLEEAFVERSERRKPPPQYELHRDWEEQLHDFLGLPWPCPMASEFWTLWPQVIGCLKAKGLRVGPASFGSWNDGDAGLVRAVWCLTRHLRPCRVVETGVARGLTSRFVVEALEKNGSGHLWSIDRPPQDPLRQQQVGIAVGSHYPHRWSYLKGSSRRRLPALLSELGQLDLFIHDSLHTEGNVRFELDRTWAVLPPGGVLLVDDIDVNRGFQSFIKAFSSCRYLVCEAEPLYPDVRRFNKKGLFGIILKDASASG